jgi:hypothetical protein
VRDGKGILQLRRWGSLGESQGDSFWEQPKRKELQQVSRDERAFLAQQWPQKSDKEPNMPCKLRI